jgi:capsular exopolysaccharide synthesis family protein
VSKMFDSLKRAEAERRKKASQRREEEAPEQAPDAPVQTPLVLAGSLPEGFAREIGVLRNSIDSALKGRERKALLFTSSTLAEGATTIAVNYAKLLAMQGSEKILLCEMNARAPSFSRLFSIDPEPGINDVLSGKSDLSAVIHDLDDYRLAVAPIGTADFASMQLHLSTQFPRLLQQALNEYTTVIFDAPAISVSPETAPMSAFVDGVVLVVQAGKTKREVIQQSINAISQQEGKVLGVILNRKKYYIPGFLYKRV